MKKQVREYQHEYHKMSSKRMAKCGHWDETGRYFKCINCQPDLEEESSDVDLIYFEDCEAGE